MSNSATGRDVRPCPDMRAERGRFDIIGDVHGCCDELIQLLGVLGYDVDIRGVGDRRCASIRAPAERRLIFVGDLVDRGPRSPDVVRIVMAAVRSGQGWCVLGNHDAKFLRWLAGRQVTLSHGLEQTVEQYALESEHHRHEVRDFLSSLPYHLWLDGGALAVAHAGIRQEMLGRNEEAVRRFCLYGDTNGDVGEDGLPVRYHWAAHHTSPTAIVYGHTPVPAAEWVNTTLCIDTGCCFGRRLTALRWPEREIASVPALETYARLRRPFGHPPVRPESMA